MYSLWLLCLLLDYFFILLLLIVILLLLYIAIDNDGIVMNDTAVVNVNGIAPNRLSRL